MKDNYACVNSECNYSTNAKEGTSTQKLDSILKQDGGFMEKKNSCCPKCKKNSLVYLY